MITLPIEQERGHLLVAIDSRKALIDTGSPVSLSPEPFDFLGSLHSPVSSIMGVTPRKISEVAGFQIDILIGCDLLSAHALRFRLGGSAMDVGDDLPLNPIQSEMELLMGIPVFPLTIQGQPAKAIFDTGAHLSYISPKLVKGQTPIGERNDFYPLIGRFVVPIYRVPTALNDMTFDIEYGIFPDSLQKMFDMGMNMSEFSAVIGTQILEHFDCTLTWAQKRISWKRR